MNKAFVKIGRERIRLTTIKKYDEYKDVSIRLYYNTSRYKIEVQTFKFDTKEIRDEMIEKLDLIFGIDD